MFITDAANEKPLARLRRTLAMAGLAALFAPAMAASVLAAAPCGSGERALVFVESVTPHLEIRLRDGRLLRLAGLEAPRGTPDNPALAEEARIALGGWIAGGGALAAIEPGEPDRWGRHAASLFAAPMGGAGELHVAGELLAGGWGRADPLSAKGDCLIWLYARESAAGASGLGLWADPHYAVIDATRAADEPERLRALAGAIVIIEGQVSGIGAGRTLTFLNLGPRRGRDPALTLDRLALAGLRQAGMSAQTLTGLRIRARGLLHPPAGEGPGGARIEILDAGAIEFPHGRPKPDANPDTKPDGNENGKK